MRSTDSVKSYYADFIIMELGKYITPYEFFEIGINYLKNATPYQQPKAVVNIISRLMAHNATITKQAILKSNSKFITKLILTTDGISIDEEVLALRAISTSKYVPEEIYKIKYKPNLKALRKLPPVMRLKTLESLVNSRKVRYDIFGHISEDNFKALLFTSSLKHTDRVSAMANKYNELKYMGQKATLEIKGNCDICGDYSIKVTSGVIRTATGLRSAAGIKLLANHYCPFCYNRMTNSPNIEKI